MQNTSILKKSDIIFFYIAPILLLASTITKSVDGVENVKAGITSGLLQCFAFIAYVFVFDRLFHFSSRQLPIFSTIFRILLILSSFGGFCFGLNAILLQLTDNEYTFWNIQGAQLFAHIGGPWPIWILITGFVFWVKKILPKHIGLLMICCGVIFPIGRIPGTIIAYYLTDILFLITFILIARRISKKFE